MGRRLTRIGRYLLLLFFLGFVTLWVRSYFITDVLEIRRMHQGYGVESHRGSITFFAIAAHFEGAGLQYRRNNDNPISENIPPKWSFVGIKRLHLIVLLEAGSTVPIVQINAYLLPIWAVCLLVGFPLIVGTSAALRRRRQSDKLCRTCGYDLRATRDRCPECGSSTAVTRVVEQQV